MSNLDQHPQVRTLADLLKSTAEQSDERINFPEGERLYAETFETPIDELKKQQTNLMTFAAAQTLAVGELAAERMQKDSSVSRVSGRSTVGHSRVETTYDREVSGQAAGKPWVKRGRAQSDVIVGTGTSTRAYRDVVAHLAEQGESLFGGE